MHFISDVKLQWVVPILLASIIIISITRVAGRKLGRGKVALLGALGDDAEAAQYRQGGHDEDDDDDDGDYGDNDDDDDTDDDAQGSSDLGGLARPACGFSWTSNWTMLVIARHTF